LRGIDLFLQDRGHEILGALLSEEALGLLAIRLVKVVGVLARVAVLVVAPNAA
jgi:hypothetical protein